MTSEESVLISARGVTFPIISELLNLPLCGLTRDEMNQANNLDYVLHRRAHRNFLHLKRFVQRFRLLNH